MKTKNSNSSSLPVVRKNEATIRGEHDEMKSTLKKIRSMLWTGGMQGRKLTLEELASMEEMVNVTLNRVEK